MIANANTIQFVNVLNLNGALIINSILKESNGYSKDALESMIDKLKEYTSIYTKNLIKSYNTTNANTVIGSEYISIQISQTDLGDEIKQSSLDNNISHIDLNDCFKDNNNNKYILGKIDFNSKFNIDMINEPLASNIVKLNLYDTIEKNNVTSICNSSNINYQFPIYNQYLVNLSKYQELNKDNIDIFNYTDKSFNSRCSPHIDNNTNYDTTINYRRSNYYQNKTVECDSDCIYGGIDEYNYTICNCSGIDGEMSNNFENKTLSILPNFNIDIVECFKEAYQYVYSINIALNIL
jgi:hypothetical protein